MPKRSKSYRNAINASKTRNKKDAAEPTRKTLRITKSRLVKSESRHKRKTHEMILEDIKAILENRQTSIGCPHYLIGAASLRYLATGRYNMRRAHQHLKQKQDAPRSETWSIGEVVVEQSHEGAYRQRFRIHPFIPFLCSKTDIAYMESTIEVKTSTSEEYTKGFDNLIPRHTLPQVWQTMECFSQPGTKIEVFLFTPAEKVLEKDKYLLKRLPERSRQGIFKKTHEITVRKSATLFDQPMIEYIVDRYLVFLQAYFRAGKMLMTENTRREARQMILETIARRQGQFSNFSDDPEECHNYLADIAKNMRAEEVGHICRKYEATELKNKFEPEGIEITCEYTRSGMKKEGYDTRRWQRDFNAPCKIYTIELGEKDREDLIKSYKKSLGAYLEKDNEGAESSLVLSPLNEVSYPEDIPEEWIEEWNKDLM